MGVSRSTSLTGSTPTRVLVTLYVVVGWLAFVAGLGILVTTYLYGLHIAVPLIAFGAFWLNAGTRMENGHSPSVVSRLLGLVACLILVIFWRLAIVEPIRFAAERFGHGYRPPISEWRHIRVLALVVGASAFSVTAYLARAARRD